jgi:7-cyano-7-deazaguanine synthase
MMMTTPPPKSIVLYSGGLDSTVLLWSLLPNVKALLINYGQRHGKELEQAIKICSVNEIEWELADLYAINKLIRKGSQSGDELPPEGHYTDLSMKTTIVPNRNSIMLSIAVGWAVATNCERVFFAAHSGDHAIYPDCRKEFVESFYATMVLANAWSPVVVRAPFVEMSKAEIVTLGQKLNVPFERTWSCYVGGAKHCGKCGTCVERKEAFQLANVIDPTEYE